MPHGFPPQPAYPDAIDSESTLYLVFDTAEARLSAANDAWAEEISIVPVGADEDDIWADNGYVNLSGEMIYYDDVERNANGKVVKFLRCLRNLDGEPPRHNPAGTVARGYVVADHHNQLVRAIIATERFIGYDFDPDEETLDWRIRNLQATQPIFDDFDCPNIDFSFSIVSSDPVQGTVVRYAITIDGEYTSFRLSFGDGKFTSSIAPGTHQYAANAVIDPVITVTANRCTLVQSPITRDNDQVIDQVDPDVQVLIPVPLCPPLGDIFIESPTLPGIDIVFPPIVLPNGPSFPSVPLISIGNIFISVPDVISFEGISLPDVISLEIPDISFPVISFEAPSFDPITVAFPSIPPLSVDVPGFPNLSIEIPDIPPLSVDFPDIPPLSVDIGAIPPLSVDIPDIPPLSVDFPDIPPLSVDIGAIPPLSVDIPDIPPLSVDFPDIPPLSVDIPLISLTLNVDVQPFQFNVNLDPIAISLTVDIPMISIDVAPIDVTISIDSLSISIDPIDVDVNVEVDIPQIDLNVAINPIDVTVSIPPLSVNIDPIDLTVEASVDPIVIQIDPIDVTVTVPQIDIALNIDPVDVNLTIDINPIDVNINPIDVDVAVDPILLTIDPITVDVNANINVFIDPIDLNVNVTPIDVNVNIDPIQIQIDPIDVNVDVDVNPILVAVDPIDIFVIVAVDPIQIDVNINPIDINVEIDPIQVDIDINPIDITVNPIDINVNVFVDPIIVQIDPIDINVTASIPNIQIDVPNIPGIQLLAPPNGVPLTGPAGGIPLQAPPAIPLQVTVTCQCSCCGSTPSTMNMNMGDLNMSPAAAPWLGARMPPGHDEQEPVEINYEFEGFPSTLSLMVPDIPPLEVRHDIPRTIELQAPEGGLRAELVYDGPPIPIDVRTLIDGLHEAVETMTPKLIRLDASEVSGGIQLHAPPAMPPIEVIGMPRELRVVGMPDHLPVIYEGPTEFLMRVDPEAKVPLVYEGGKIPLDVTVKVDYSTPIVEEAKAKGKCFMLLPCN